MNNHWLDNPILGYREDARHLFGYPESTVGEYVRDLGQFSGWLQTGAAGSSEGLPEQVSTSLRQASSRSGLETPGPENPDRPGSVDADAFSRANGSLRLLSVSREDVEGWVVHLSNRGLKAASINRKIAALNSFYLWAMNHRLVEKSPLAGVRKLKTPRRIPKFLTFEDIRKLLEYTGSAKQTATIRGKQIHALISILYYLGLRRQELVDLRFEHIEKIAGSEVSLHVFGKGDKQRLVPFPEPAFRAYEEYVRYRPECQYSQVFISLHSRRPLSKHQVNNFCDQLSRKVELSKKLTPHLLRHTFATHLHLKGQPIEHINALLGHESLDTTKIYVHIDSGKLRKAVEQLC